MGEKVEMEMCQIQGSNILLIRDVYSGLCVGCKVATNEAVGITRCFMKNWVNKYGMPDRVIPYNMENEVRGFISDLFNKIGIAISYPKEGDKNENNEKNLSP